MKTYLKWLGVYIVFMILITLVWQLYELFVYNEIKPDAFDTVITAVLSASLTNNIFQSRYIKQINKKKEREINEHSSLSRK